MQHFSDFITEWVRLRLATIEPPDFEVEVERRSRELAELAMQEQERGSPGRRG